MKKEYQATFILDTHKWREPIDALVEQVKGLIVEMGADIVKVEDLGLKSFARCPRKEFVTGQYVTITCKADASFNKILQERIGLNPNVNRVIVEAVKA